MSDQVLKRLVKFLAAEGFKPEDYHALEREMGWSKDSVNRWLRGKQKNIGADRFIMIIVAFPKLSAEWLIRGVGTMYVSKYRELQNRESINFELVRIPKKEKTKQEYLDGELYITDN